jgi:hypothetical protein
MAGGGKGDPPSVSLLIDLFVNTTLHLPPAIHLFQPQQMNRPLKLRLYTMK